MKRVRIWLLSAILCITCAGVPIQYASAQGWGVAVGVVSGISSYLGSRKNNKDHAEIKRQLAEIRKQLTQIDTKLTKIQQTLIDLGDYLKGEFNDLYISNVSKQVDVTDQDLDKFDAHPTRYKREILDQLTALRTATIALEGRPPGAYDWVGTGMAYEDLLASKLPRGTVSRKEIFIGHANYFTATIADFEDDAMWLNTGIESIEKYHADLAAKLPILQYIKTDNRSTRNCFLMKMKIYRIITGTLKDGYALTGKEVTQDIKCIMRNEPRHHDGGIHNFYAMDANGVGTPTLEDTPPVIPTRVEVGQLNASRADWVARKDRLANLQSMIADCKEYLRMAQEFAKLR